MAPFIVIEGIDGSGKGTQAKLLVERFKGAGRDVLLTAEPTNGPVGKLIREHMSNPFLDDQSLALLFAADRIEHLVRDVRPALEAKKVVISDRYVYSSIAYQGQTIDIDWVASINSYADKPDLVVLIDISPEEARKRLEERERDFEVFEKDLSFQEGIRKSFLGFAKGHHLPPSLKTEFLVVNGALDRSEVADIIWDRVSRLL